MCATLFETKMTTSIVYTEYKHIIIILCLTGYLKYLCIFITCKTSYFECNSTTMIVEKDLIDGIVIQNEIELGYSKFIAFG